LTRIDCIFISLNSLKLLDFIHMPRKCSRLPDLKVVSKPQIMLESKAQADEKAQSRRRRDEPSKEACNAAIGN
jgi:hypothetical protein